MPLRHLRWVTPKDIFFKYINSRDGSILKPASYFDFNQLTYALMSCDVGNVLQIIPYVTLLRRYHREVFLYRHLQHQYAAGFQCPMVKNPAYYTSPKHALVDSIIQMLGESMGLRLTEELRSTLFSKLIHYDYRLLYQDGDYQVGVWIDLYVSNQDITQPIDGYWISPAQLINVHNSSQVALEPWTQIILPYL